MGIIFCDAGLKSFFRLPINVCFLLLIVSFSYIYISQGSVATQLRYSGIFNNCFIVNFEENVPVKEFSKRSIFGKLWTKVW